MSILNNIWNRIARKPDRRKAAATETSGTENRVYAVVTEEGVMLFSDTPKGMKARNSYLQHLADGFFKENENYVVKIFPPENIKEQLIVELYSK